MAYHITGLISAAIFLLTVGGLWSQLRFIFERKRTIASGDPAHRPTAILSLNQFVSSFLAFFSFVLYGACLQRFNHYLVWPRFLACLLTLAVLCEMMRDRRDGLSIAAFSACLGLLVAGPAVLLFNPRAAGSGEVLLQGVVVVGAGGLGRGVFCQGGGVRGGGQAGGGGLGVGLFFFF